MEKSSIFTPKYFEKVIQHFLNLSSPPKVTNLKIGPCNEKGDGFLSTIYRITIEYIEINSSSAEKISIIAKCECTDEFSLEKVGKDGYDVQNKEIKFFQQIEPKMTKIFVEKSQKVIPEVIKIDAENEILLFEDLRELNYKMQHRMIGLDEEHVKLSLDKFAKFHAASLKMAENDSKIFEDFQDGMFSRNLDKFDNSMYNMYGSAVDEILTWTEFEVYGRKMQKNHEKVVENLKKCFDLNLSEFNVLNHGDLWTTNLMFRYNDNSGCPEEAVIIDFQFCHYASAALDLIHFLFTSLNDDIYNPQDIQRFVKIYYHKLIENVKNFDCKFVKIPKFTDFLNQFYGKMFYGLMFTMCIFPLMTSDDPDNDFKTHHTNDEKSKNFRSRVMKAERYQKIVKKMLPFYDAIGLLD